MKQEEQLKFIEEINKISNESPIGKALLGAKKGSTVEVNAPAGVIKYQILSITK